MGFNICLWWLINTNHPLARCVKEISTRLYKTSYAPAHVSVRTNLHHFPHERSVLTEYIYIRHRRLKMTVTSLATRQFYALELPVTPVFPLRYNAHVSLAYRLDYPFSTTEIKMASDILQSYDVATITPEDVTPTVVDASSYDPKDWKRL